MDKLSSPLPEREGPGVGRGRVIRPSSIATATVSRASTHPNPSLSGRGF